MKNATRSAWTDYVTANGWEGPSGVRYAPSPEPRTNKFGAQKITEDGYTFDSKREAGRYQELKWRLKAGEIADLELQPIFPLFIIRMAYSGPIHLEHVGKYTADFQYTDLKSGEIVVEDVKSEATRVGEAYRLRKRVAEAVHGITITEIT